MRHVAAACTLIGYRGKGRRRDGEIVGMYATEERKGGGRDKEKGRVRTKEGEGGKRWFTGEAGDLAGNADIATQGLGHPIFQSGEGGERNGGSQGSRVGGGKGSGGP